MKAVKTSWEDFSMGQYVLKDVVEPCKDAVEHVLVAVV
jgi:hypothetical protein